MKQNVPELSSRQSFHYAGAAPPSLGTSLGWATRLRWFLPLTMSLDRAYTSPVWILPAAFGCTSAARPIARSSTGGPESTVHALGRWKNASRINSAAGPAASSHAGRRQRWMPVSNAGREGYFGTRRDVAPQSSIPIIVMEGGEEKKTCQGGAKSSLFTRGDPQTRLLQPPGCAV